MNKYEIDLREIVQVRLIGGPCHNHVIPVCVSSETVRIPILMKSGLDIGQVAYKIKKFKNGKSYGKLMKKKENSKCVRKGGK